MGADGTFQENNKLVGTTILFSRGMALCTVMLERWYGSTLVVVVLEQSFCARTVGSHLSAV